MPTLPLFEETFLRAQWDAEFRASETAFIQRFYGLTQEEIAMVGTA